MLGVFLQVCWDMTCDVISRYFTFLCTDTTSAQWCHQLRHNTIRDYSVTPSSWITNYVSYFRFHAFSFLCSGIFSAEQILTVTHSRIFGNDEPDISVFLRSVLQLLVTGNVVPSSLIFSPWWWRWYVPPKHRFLQEPHGLTFQKTAFFIVTAVETSILHSINWLYSVVEM
jgi:hypothetical protein